MINVTDLLRKIRIKLCGGATGIGNLDLLKKRGLKVGKNFQALDECVIDSSHCWLISIGDNVTFAPGVHVIAHDASTKHHLGYTKIGLVSIGNNAFIGEGSIILPNVKIGNNVVVGSGSVVANDIPDNCVAAGNPAKVISTIDEYLRKHKENMKTRPLFDESWALHRNISENMKKIMIEKLKDGIGYIVGYKE